jgi:hypothetical protein
MPKNTEVSARAFIIDGGTKRWPQSVDKFEVSVKVPAPLATLPEGLGTCFANVDALNHLLNVQTYNAMLGNLAAWLNEKIPQGEGAEPVQRSALPITVEDVQAFLDSSIISPPERKRGGEKKVGAVAKARKELAEQKARADAIAVQSSALVDAMRSMLAAMPDTPERAAQIAAMIAAGTLPVDFTV